MLKIAIANEKGGVGKTTTAVALADLFAESGKRVLVVDLDAQGSATAHLLGKPARDDGAGLLRALGGGRKLSLVARRCRTIRAAQVTPAGKDLQQATHMYRDRVAGGHSGLREALEAESDIWDVVIFDCPPKSPFELSSALAAADFALIATELEPSAVRGLADLTHTIRRVKDTLNPSLSVVGILPTKVQAQRRLTLEIRDVLVESYGRLVFDSYIRNDAAVPESDGRAKPVTRRKASNAAADYRDAFGELRARIDVIRSSVKAA